MLRKIRVKGVSPRWLVLPAVFPVALAVATAAVYGVLSAREGVAILRPDAVDELGWALKLVIPFTFAAAITGSPLGEEPGWRGYVFDHFAPARG